MVIGNDFNQGYDIFLDDIVGDNNVIIYKGMMDFFFMNVFVQEMFKLMKGK